MKTINLKNAVVAGLLVYVIGITFFIGSYYLPLMEDQELQSNITLVVAIIPAAIVGAVFYYRNNHTTNGLALGLVLFLIAAILDAIITVPLFIIPAGGNHVDFFTNPWFWLIGVAYVLTVVVYRHFRK